MRYSLFYSFLLYFHILLLNTTTNQVENIPKKAKKDDKKGNKDKKSKKETQGPDTISITQSSQATQQ